MTYSPLRYPGGKSSLYDFLKRTLKENSIIDGIYVEPFAGGAGAALKLLMLEDVYEIYLNDKDEMVYKFWISILSHTEEFIELIDKTEITIERWNYYHTVLVDTELRSRLSDLEVGFAAFFLNRCNRSGILKAGVIGGYSQLGDWTLDARFNKADLIDRIRKIALYKDRIKVYNLDAVNFLNYIDSKYKNQQDVFIYLDPPYVKQGEGLYNIYFKIENHTKLAQFLQKKMKNKWLVSYDDDELIHDIYKEVNKNIFEFNYFANRTKIGRELIICSKNCIMPKMYKHYSKERFIPTFNFTNDVAI